MRVTERWKGNKKPSLSFEIFPARTLKGMENLVRVINELITLEPDFFSVTFGAGESEMPRAEHPDITRCHDCAGMHFVNTPVVGQQAADIRGQIIGGGLSAHELRRRVRGDFHRVAVRAKIDIV